LAELETKRKLQEIGDEKYKIELKFLEEKARASKAETETAIARQEAAEKNFRLSKLDIEYDAEQRRCSFLWIGDFCLFKTYKPWW